MADGGSGSAPGLGIDEANVERTAGLPVNARSGHGGARPSHLPVDATSAQRRALEKAAPQAERRPKAQLCVAHGRGLTGGHCGERLQFTVSVVGEDGQPFRTGGARVTAVVTGTSLVSKTVPEPRPWVQDQNDGTYLVQFVCAAPGQYLVNAYVEGAPLVMCPVHINVTPGPASAFNSEIRGDGAQACNLGGSAEFQIFARDEFGNACTEGGGRFGVRAIGHARLHEVADNEDGTYTVLYSVPEWSQGAVQLEVLLDGALVKGSPLTPHVLRPEKRAPAGASPERRPLPTRLADQVEALQWLSDNPPADVPRLPGLGDQLGVSPEEAATHFGDGLPTDQAAMRLAWRAADEWRRLADARDEMARCRDALAEHQAMLLSVSDAVRHEYLTMEEQTRGMDLRQRNLDESTSRLDNLRLDMGWQYMQQQKWIANGQEQVQARETPEKRRWAETGFHKNTISWNLEDSSYGGLRDTPRSPDGGRAPPIAGKGDWPILDCLGTQVSGDTGGFTMGLEHKLAKQAQFEAEQLQALQDGIAEKRRYLDQLMESDYQELPPPQSVFVGTVPSVRADGGPARTAPWLRDLEADKELSAQQSVFVGKVPSARADGGPARVAPWLRDLEGDKDFLAPRNVGMLGGSVSSPPPPKSAGPLAGVAPWLRDVGECKVRFQPPEPPPLDAVPPPEPVGELPARARGRGRIQEPLPPPAPPPALADSVISLAEPAGEQSPSGIGLGQSGLGSLTSSPARSERGMQLLRNPPPPPRAPPLGFDGASVCDRRVGALEGRSATPTTGSTNLGWDALASLPAAGAHVSWDVLSPPPDAGGTPSQELGQASRQLFSAFASRSVGAVALPRGARSGRLALGLQDFVRFANAAQLRLPTRDLEAAFQETVRRFGVAPRTTGDEPTLAFELFVELLVEIGHRRYPDLSDGQATEALFQEHLQPLARRLRELERTTDAATPLLNLPSLMA